MGPVMWVSYIALAKGKKIVLIIQEGSASFYPPAHKAMENPKRIPVGLSRHEWSLTRNLKKGKPEFQDAPHFVHSKV